MNYEADIKVRGYIEIPNKATKRAEQYIFVNNRFITDRIILAAVIRGYEGFIMKDQKPRYIIMIEVEPREVDINVHPRKLEVRFRDMDYIFRTVVQVIKSSIEKNNIKKLDDYKFNIPQQIPDKIRDNQYANKIHMDYGRSISQEESLGTRLSKKTYTIENPINIEFDHTYGYINKKYIQLFDSYILVIENNKVIMIDQHAAAERITYEKLENVQKETVKVMLLPIKFELSDEKVNLIKENKKILESYGIMFEITKTDITINAIPSFIEISDLREFIEDIINELIEIKRDKNKYEKIKDHIRATLACHTSIRANKKLTDIEMESLVKELYNCKNPMNCPHGRPTIWELTKTEIEKKFKRS